MTTIVLGTIIPLVFRNNIGIIPDSKSEKCKNIQARQKVDILIKKEFIVQYLW